MPRPTMTAPTAATTLADLMRMGAKITFESGRSMKGDVATGYVLIANEFDGLGVWDLNTDAGIGEAIDDLVRDAKDDGVDLHGRPLPGND